MRLLKITSSILLVMLLFSCSMQNKDPLGASKLDGNLEEKIKYASNSSNYNSEHDRLHDVFAVFYNWQMEISPINATYSGVNKYNDKWDDFSPAGVEKRNKGYELFKETLDWFDQDKLSTDDQLNYTIYSSFITSTYNLYVLFPEQYFILDQVQGIHNAIPHVLKTMPVQTEEDLLNLLTRLESLPVLFDGLQQILRQGIKKGYVMSKYSVLKVPEQIEVLITDDVASSVFYKPISWSNFKGDNILLDSVRGKAQRIIEDSVNPALKSFLAFVEKEYLPATRETIGLKDVKGGEQWYKERIRYHTTTDMSAQEIHELGKQEVARIKKEMQSIIDEIGFKGNMNAFNEFLRTDSRFFYKTSEELIRAYRDICKRIDPELVKIFGHLPRNTYGVAAVPSYSEQATTTAYYQPGSYDAGIPGYFMANTYKLDSRPKWEMEALSIHEAVPGHHLQISIQQELDNIPKFRENAFFTSYVEGWALYAESLGYEMGMYKDPYSRYGQLVYEMWRAIRLVVDTGIHALDWTRDDAIKYFKENIGKSEQDIIVEVDRYIAWPGQALAYKIGQIKISELRTKAETELGDKFDIRSFHDELLAYGAVPLDVLEDIIDKWIEKKLAE